MTTAQTLTTVNSSMTTNQASAAALLRSLRQARANLSSYSGSSAGVSAVLSAYLSAKSSADTMLNTLAAQRAQAKSLVQQL